MTLPSAETSTLPAANRPGFFLPAAAQFEGHAGKTRVSLRVRCWWCWNNLCRLFLIKVWFQLVFVLFVTGWWLVRRDAPATLATVAITLVLSSWMMSRERIRRSLAGDHASSRLSGRMDDDWSTLERQLLSLDEINNKRQAQERKDRTACRIGIICTVLAGIVAVAGFRK